jgi:hypothetical protein
MSCCVLFAIIKRVEVFEVVGEACVRAQQYLTSFWCNKL